MTNKIRVMQVVPSLGLGGYERVVANLCADVDNTKFDVSVCCLKHISVLGEQLGKKGVKIHALSEGSSGLNRYTVFLKLKKYIIDQSFDIIHSHGTGALLDATFAKLLLGKRKLIHTFHYGNYPNFPVRYLCLEALCSRVPDRLVAVSEDQRQRLMKAYHLKPERIATIWNGVKENNSFLDVGKIRDSFGIPGNALVVGTIGNLIEQKGYPYFLETCRRVNTIFPDTFFLVIGGGPLEQELKTRARDLGLGEKVIFTGFRRDATDILHIFDIFLLASLWEAMPIVLLEAMATGKSVVATDVGENSRIVSEGETGFIVQAKDVDTMVQRVVLLLGSEDKRKEMGNKAKERFRLLFTSRAMAARYERLYESLVKN